VLDPLNNELQVWVTMPTACAEHSWAAFEAWKKQGYLLSVFTDPGKVVPMADLMINAKYPGVWNACNALAKAVVALGADVCVFAGDDMRPDPKHSPQEIALQYLQRFPTGYGIMQPCGDKQGSLIEGKWNSARIIGSGWFGKEWIRRAYKGNGPTDGRYWHFYADEDLYEVSKKLGVLWMREDLIQDHLHWSFGRTKKQGYHQNNQAHWNRDKAIFNANKAKGFPNGDPIQ
jgi:hypothetical protein